MPLPELTMLFELDKLFRVFFESARWPRYGISVTDVEPDRSVIYVEFRFLKAHSYCCGEPACHIPLRCNRLVRLAVEHSIKMPDGVVVRWHCIVEEGARLQCHAGLLALESEGYAFDYVTGGPLAMNESTQISQRTVPADFTGLWTVNHDGDRTEIEYVKGVASGCYRSWLRNGVCIREGTRKDGKWHGLLITRGSDGAVLDVSEFNEGTGIYRIFNSRGRLTDEIPLRHGKAHGTAKRWCHGELAEIRHYVEGEFVAANIEA